MTTPSIDGNAAAMRIDPKDPAYPADFDDFLGMPIRLVLAAQFAAAWRPLLKQPEGFSPEAAIAESNRLGIWQADDLIAQLNQEAK